MYEWRRQIQTMINEIDDCIKRREDENLTLGSLSRKLGYSEYHTTRKFKELSGMSFREYLRLRRLAFALIDVRDGNGNFLEIAVDYGFSSHEALTRSFKAAYGVTPAAYRKHPAPVVLRTKINTFDRYILGIGEIGMLKSSGEVKIYFVSVPAHKFMHIKNYDSDGYFDFWERQENIKGQDCHTICGLLDSVKGKLDGDDGEIGKFGGQIMAYINEDDGRCPEAYGIRLPVKYSGPVPEQMLLIDISEGDYIVFEHGPFDYEQENESVGKLLWDAISSFSYEGSGYEPDDSPGRISYFYHDMEKYMKRLLPVKKCGENNK